MGHTFEGINSRLDETEDLIRDLEENITVSTQAKHPSFKNKRILKNEESLKGLWDNIKFNKTSIIGVPREESEHKVRNLFEEIMAKSFPNLVKK